MFLESRMKSDEGDDCFRDVSDEMIEYLTKEGIGYVERAEKSFYIIRENIRKLVFLLLSGAGASTLLFLNSIFDRGLFCTGFLICAAGWLLCGGYLALKGLKPLKRPTGWTSPEALYFQGVGINELKRRKLEEYCYAGDTMLSINRDLCNIYDSGINASIFTCGLGLVASIPYFFI